MNHPPKNKSTSLKHMLFWLLLLFPPMFTIAGFVAGAFQLAPRIAYTKSQRCKFACDGLVLAIEACHELGPDASLEASRAQLIDLAKQGFDNGGVSGDFVL